MMMMMTTTISCLSLRFSVGVPVGLHERTRIDFHEICYFSIFPKSVAKIQFGIYLTRITGTFHEHVFTSVILSHQIPLRMRNVSDKILEKTKTHFMLSSFFS
jgi:hypothetical protein